MQSVALIEQWPVHHAATAVIAADGSILGRHGDQHHVFQLASVTKLITSYAALIAVEEGVSGLDDPAGPDGCTIRHLLAHAGGYAFDEHTVVSTPGRRRLYSNAGIEVLADELAKRSGIPFADYVRDAVLGPLGMRDTSYAGSPASGASSSVADLAAFAAEIQQPSLLDPSTVEEATGVVFPGLDGVLPGFGRQTPNDWGLGFEIRGHKSPHWTGSTNSPSTFGHFGQSGSFLWIDPEAGVGCVALADRSFGPWAAESWPAYTDAVLTELRA